MKAPKFHFFAILLRIRLFEKGFRSAVWVQPGLQERTHFGLGSNRSAQISSRCGSSGGFRFGSRFEPTRARQPPGLMLRTRALPERARAWAAALSPRSSA